MALQLPPSFYTTPAPATTTLPAPLVQSRLGTGIFGNLFDLMSRPSSAVQTGINYSLDKNKQTTFLQGLKEGITGKTKTSMADTLRQHGVTGPVGAVLGFAGDVALDPLTYVGGKFTKGMTADEALLSAIKTSPSAIEATATDLLAKNPSTVGLTFAGKKFGPQIGVTDVGQKVVEKLLGPATDRKVLAKAFSRNSELPLGLNNMSRVIENSNNALFNDFRSGIKSIFMGDLTPEQRATITDGIANGHTLDTVPVEKVGARFNNLGDYQKLAQKITDDAFLKEAKLGYHEQLPGTSGNLVTDYKGYDPNYVYKYFLKPPENLTAKLRSTMTLAQAEAGGMQPVKDIHDLLDLRMASHYRDMAKGTFARDAVDQFAVPADVIKNLSTDSPLHQFNWKPAEATLKNVIGQKTGVGKMIPEFVAKGLNQAEGTFSSSSTANDVLRGYDKIMNQWKFLNTAAMPGKHIRDGFGDYLMNLADGVRNPQRYAQAIKVVKSVEDNNAASLAQLIDPAATSIPSTAAKIKIGDQMMPVDQVWKLYGESGSKSGIITTELQRSLNSTEKSALSNHLSRVKSAIGDFADKREDIFRVAHFIDAMDKQVSSGVGLNEAVQQAGKQVRKFNIDYGNLSTFEKDVARRIIPFYTYMRKATPLNMELLFTKPGFMALYPKGRDLAQGLLGTTDENGTPIIPSWITDMAPVRLAQSNQANRNPFEKLIASLTGAGNNEAAFLSSTTGMTPIDTLKLPLAPIQKLAQGDISGALRAPVGDIAQMFTPAIKAPVEAATGQQMFTNAPITNWPGWLANQVGPGRAVTKGISQNVGSSLTSNVLGLPVQVATVQRQAGEFYKNQAAADAKAHELKLQQMRTRFPNWDNLNPAQQRKLLSGVKNPRLTDPTLAAQRKYVQGTLGQ